jgi:hypothetical protein
MNDRIKSLGAEAMKLEPSERVQLADLILASVQEASGGLEKGWPAEVAERVHSLALLKDTAEDADDVIAEVRTKISK